MRLSSCHFSSFKIYFLIYLKCPSFNDQHCNLLDDIISPDFPASVLTVPLLFSGVPEDETHLPQGTQLHHSQQPSPSHPGHHPQQPSPSHPGHHLQQPCPAHPGQVTLPPGQTPLHPGPNGLHPCSNGLHPCPNGPNGLHAGPNGLHPGPNGLHAGPNGLHPGPTPHPGGAGRLALGPRIQALQSHLARITEDMNGLEHSLEQPGIKSSLV